MKRGQLHSDLSAIVGLTSCFLNPGFKNRHVSGFTGADTKLKAAARQLGLLPK
jgi:hypothetical protein